MLINIYIHRSARRESNEDSTNQLREELSSDMKQLSNQQQRSGAKWEWEESNEDSTNDNINALFEGKPQINFYILIMNNFRGQTGKCSQEI